VFFKTYQESLQLLDLFGVKQNDLKDRATKLLVDVHDVTEIGGKQHVPFAAARYWARHVAQDKTCLLLVTEYGIWPSRENQHLFYKVRATYDERRHIHDAPGHYFLEYELADLVTFLDLVIQFGWGAHLIPSPATTSLFISHDGWARQWKADDGSVVR
jgi:hypothetical protein